VELTIEKIGDVSVVELAGEQLDASNVKEFKHEIAPVLAANPRMVLDLGRLRFIDSSGLGAILSCLRQLNTAGGELKLCGLSKPVRALFELVRQGHHDKARELQAALVRASKFILSEAGIAGLKHVMDQRGYRGGIPRLPLLPLQLEQKKRLNDFLTALEPAVVRA